LRGCNAFPWVLAVAREKDSLAAGERFYNFLLDRYGLAVVPGTWFRAGEGVMYAGNVRLSFGGATEVVREGVLRFVRAVEEFSGA
jgi:aspartate/methionine/tyrosine aminotransferase